MEVDSADALVRDDVADLPFRTSVFDAVTGFDPPVHVPLSERRTVIYEFARSGSRALALGSFPPEGY